MKKVEQDALRLADEAASVFLASECEPHEGPWLDLSKTHHGKRMKKYTDYLERRGLLKRNAENPNLVKLRRRPQS